MSIRSLPVPKLKPWERHQRSPGAYTTVPVGLAIDPNADRVAGGSTVTITGANFLSGGAVTVTFGGVASPSVTVLSNTSLSVVVPEATDDTPGIVDVVITVGTYAVTMANAFLYYAGSISSLTPNYSLTSGGVFVRIRGTNFLNGSTITFDGVPATNVVFVDSSQFIATVPAHAGAGPVDIVITEPVSGVTITGRGLFTYTGVLQSSDIRRQPGVRIQDNLNNAPNTCDFRVDGRSAAPVVGTGVEFTDDETIIFSGNVAESTLSFEGSDPTKPGLAYWQVHAVDRTSRLNNLLPFGTYDNQSVSDIVVDLMTRYAPWVSTLYVQTHLARVSAVFDGSQDLRTLLTSLAQSLGEGHWRLDYRNRLHFFHKKSLNVPPIRLPSSPLALGPGTAMTVTESTERITGSFEPGWYYFKTTSKYGGPTTFGAPLLLAPAGYVLLSNEAAALNLTGTVSNGSYSPNGVTFFPRGWVGYAGLSYIPEGQWASYPPGGNTVYFASPDVANVLEAQVGAEFESSYGPISNAIYLETYRPTFTGIPIAPDIGGYGASHRRIFFVRFSDISGVGGTRTTGYLEIADNVTTTITSEPTIFLDGPPVINTMVAAGPATAPFLAESTTLLNADEFFQWGYWAVMVSGVYQDGTESYPSPASNAMLLGGRYQVTVSQLPIFSAINGVACIFRKIYASIYVPAPNAGTPDFFPGHTNLSYIVVDNTSTNATFFLGRRLSGGDGNPDYPAGVPLGIVTATGHVDGPWLEDDEKPTDLTNDNPYLLVDPPPQYAEDVTQLRNRIYVKGKGTTLAADAVIGDTIVKVADASMFLDSGGTFIVGSRVISYAGRNTASGASYLTLVNPLERQLLQSNWLYGGGLPIRPFVQVDDVQSQLARSIVELDPDGTPMSGVHEYSIDDDSLATTEQCIARGQAELQKFAWPLKKLTYYTRDPLSQAGKIITANLAQPAVVGDFIIQSVTIDQYREINDTLSPRYFVQADSAARFNFNDLLLYLDDRASRGGASLAGIIASGQNDGNTGVDAALSGRHWFQSYLLNSGGAAVPAGIGNGNVNTTGTVAFQRDTVAIGGVQRVWIRYSCTGAANGGGINLDIASTQGYSWWEFLPKMRVRVRTGQNLYGNGNVYWIGFFEQGTIPNNSPILTARHIAILGNGTVSGGSSLGLIASTGDGSGQAKGSFVGTLNPLSEYVLTVEALSTTLARLTVHDVTAGFTTSADIPVNNITSAGSSTKPGLTVAAYMTAPLSASTSIWDVASLYAERN